MRLTVGSARPTTTPRRADAWDVRHRSTSRGRGRRGAGLTSSISDGAIAGPGARRGHGRTARRHAGPAVRGHRRVRADRHDDRPRHELAAGAAPQRPAADAARSGSVRWRVPASTTELLTLALSERRRRAAVPFARHRAARSERFPVGVWGPPQHAEAQQVPEGDVDRGAERGRRSPPRPRCRGGGPPIDLPPPRPARTAAAAAVPAHRRRTRTAACARRRKKLDRPVGEPGRRPDVVVLGRRVDVRAPARRPVELASSTATVAAPPRSARSATAWRRSTRGAADGRRPSWPAQVDTQRSMRPSPSPCSAPAAPPEGPSPAAGPQCRTARGPARSAADARRAAQPRRAAARLCSRGRGAAAPSRSVPSPRRRAAHRGPPRRPPPAWPGAAAAGLRPAAALIGRALRRAHQVGRRRGSRAGEIAVLALPNAARDVTRRASARRCAFREPGPRSSCSAPAASSGGPDVTRRDGRAVPVGTERIAVSGARRRRRAGPALAGWHAGQTLPYVGWSTASAAAARCRPRAPRSPGAPTAARPAASRQRELVEGGTPRHDPLRRPGRPSWS